MSQSEGSFLLWIQNPDVNVLQISFAVFCRYFFQVDIIYVESVIDKSVWSNLNLNLIVGLAMT